MSRIAATFEALAAQQKTALIPYVTAGDSNPSITVPLMHSMVDAGADIIELGVPFSDPMADGPTIQLACERALTHHVSLADVIDMVAEFRQRNQTTPVVLMGYLNPVEVMGYKQFAQSASTAGVDATLIVDLPPEESHDVLPIFKQYSLDSIYLLAPTTTPQRMKMVCNASSGFVYYVSLKGVTGANSLDVSAVTKRLAKIRSLSDLPIGVGFGVKDADTAAQLSQIADAVVVGSVLVKMIEDNVDNADKIINNISELLSSMRRAMDSL